MLKSRLLHRRAEFKDAEVQLEDGARAKLSFKLLRSPGRRGVEKFAETFTEVLPLFSKFLDIKIDREDLPQIWIGRTREMGFATGTYYSDKNVIQVPAYVITQPYDQDTVRHEIGHFFTFKALFGKLPVKYWASMPREEVRAGFANGDKNNVIAYNSNLLYQIGVEEGIAELFSIYPQKGARQRGAKEIAFELVRRCSFLSGTSGRRALNEVITAANEAKTTDAFFSCIKIGKQSEGYGIGGAVLAAAILNNQSDGIDKTVRDILKDPLVAYGKIRGTDPHVLTEYKAHNMAMTGERFVGLLKKTRDAILYSRPAQLFAGASAIIAAGLVAPGGTVWLGDVGINIYMYAAFAMLGAGVYSLLLRK